MHKIKLGTAIIPFLWIAFSILTFFVFYTENNNLKWIDIPTHLAGGMLVALIINGKGPVTNLKKTFILSFLVLLSWELFEIIASTISHRELIVDIFKETVGNKTRDVAMGIIGFLGFAAIRK
jgi:hypothetical protein